MSALLHLTRARMAQRHIVRARPAHTRGLFDACPSAVEIEDFKRSCTVPLYPGRWNTWRMLGTMARDRDTVALSDSLREAMRFWFAESDMDPADWIRVKFSMPIEWGPLNQPEGNPFDYGARVAATRNDCRHPLTVAVREGYDNDQYIVIYVAFVYRGSQTSMPWPAWRKDPGFFGVESWCPMDADWVVDRVYEPMERDVPPVREDERGGVDGAIDDIIDVGTGAAETIKDTAKTTLSIGPYVLGGAALIGATVYAATKAR